MQKRSFGTRSLVLVTVGLALLAHAVGPAQAATPTPKPSPAPVPAIPGSTPDKTATFGVGPSNEKALDSRSDITVLASPGARATEHVGVVNLSDEPLPVDVYLTEAVTAPDGSIGYTGRDQPLTDAGSWVRVVTTSEGSRITLPPRSTTILPLQIAVPSNAEPGDHTDAVVVSLTSAAQAGGPAAPNAKLEQRVATRVYFRVSGTLRPQLSVQAVHASYAGVWSPIGTGSTTVRYQIRNNGNVRLKVHNLVSVSGFLHTSKLKGPEVPLLLPGASVDVAVPVKGVWPQILDSARVTAEGSAYAADRNPGVEPGIGQTRFWAVPWMLLALLVATGFLLWRAWRWWRRPRGGRHGGSSPKHSRERVPAVRS